MVCNGFVVETITISVMVSIVFFSRDCDTCLCAFELLHRSKQPKEILESLESQTRQQDRKVLFKKFIIIIVLVSVENQWLSSEEAKLLQHVLKMNITAKWKTGFVILWTSKFIRIKYTIIQHKSCWDILVTEHSLNHRVCGRHSGSHLSLSEAVINR